MRRKNPLGCSEKSEAVIRGKVTEHLIPYFPDFEYNPKDARFLGTPVDFIIFDGLSEGEMNRVVFEEVKSVKTGALSQREKLVEECISRGKVSYKIIHNKGISFRNFRTYFLVSLPVFLNPWLSRSLCSRFSQKNLI
jgi:predicted Holliday junction resolvase-like endonuclease